MRNVLLLIIVAILLAGAIWFFAAERKAQVQMNQDEAADKKAGEMIFGH